MKCCKKANAENLLHAGVHIKTFPHPTLNYSKGVICTRELDDVAEEGIKTQGEMNVKTEEQIIKINTYIITFNKPILPESIRIGFLSVSVDL